MKKKELVKICEFIQFLGSDMKTSTCQIKLRGSGSAHGSTKLGENFGIAKANQ